MSNILQGPSVALRKTRWKNISRDLLSDLEESAANSCLNVENREVAWRVDSSVTRLHRKQVRSRTPYTIRRIRRPRPYYENEIVQAMIIAFIAIAAQLHITANQSKHLSASGRRLPAESASHYTWCLSLRLRLVSLRCLALSELLVLYSCDTPVQTTQISCSCEQTSCSCGAHNFRLKQRA